MFRVNKLRPQLSLSKFHRRSSNYAGNGVLGIVREEYGMWERRAPLAPRQVEEMIKQHGVKVLIQPCNRRIFTDVEYAKAGAVVTDNLDDASLIIGVKKMPLAPVAGKSYLFFSHVIKAQPVNMHMLDNFVEKKARLFDYECITIGGRDDTNRLVAFGKYAGMAGMVDGFQGLGMRLLSEGYSNPFLNIPFSFMHENLDRVRESLKAVGAHISEFGLPMGMSPLVFAFTGSGNVAKGAKEMFEILPHEYVTVAELKTLKADVQSGKRKSNVLYGVNVTAHEMVKCPDGSPLKDKAHYYANPEGYHPIFHENILPHITVLVNGMYWDYRYPRLITKEQIANLRKSGNKELKVVSDISCDIGGSCEFLTHSTTIEKPFFSYYPESGETDDNVDKHGILMCGVDILPSELPRDATEHFGKALLPLLPPVLKSAGTPLKANGEVDMSDLPKEMQRACIACHGKLMPKWSYISRLREQSSVLHKQSKAARHVNVELRGHLFDSGLINSVMDLLEKENDKCNFSITNCDVRANTTSGAVPSKILLQISGTESNIKDVAGKVADLVQNHPSAEGSFTMKDMKHVASTVEVKTMARKRVLIFGAGRVAKPVLRLFHPQDDVFISLASDDETQSKELLSCLEDPDGNRSEFLPFRFPESNASLDELMKNCDVAISLLPATMHLPIAEAALRQRRPLVTASYVSPGMQALHERANEAGVLLLNEMGLDPGIDHMLIMKAIDDCQSRGGQVEELVSLCGGLPDPVAADNPFRYKISWSPRGMLNAAGNSAQYLQQGKLIQVPGERLLQSAQPCQRFPTLRLEVLPNRDSLSYRSLYKIPDVQSICRGTLRYEGWANVMYGLRALGLFQTDAFTKASTASTPQTWSDFFSETILKKGYSLKEVLQQAGVVDIENVLEAAQWLGLITEDGRTGSSAVMKRGAIPIDAFCALMEEKLTFTESEKDMVAMFHAVKARFPDGHVEEHASRLLAFGTPGGDSAMSATVGYTAAAGAEMVLRGQLSHRSGVMIPNTPDIYEPMLKRLQQFGISWTESVHKF